MHAFVIRVNPCSILNTNKFLDVTHEMVHFIAMHLHPFKVHIFSEN